MMVAVFIHSRGETPEWQPPADLLPCALPHGGVEVAPSCRAAGGTAARTDLHGDVPSMWHQNTKELPREYACHMHPNLPWWGSALTSTTSIPEQGNKFWKEAQIV